MRHFLRRISDSLYYWKLWRAMTPAERFIPASTLAKAPICWVRGHSWEHGPSFAISPWTAQFCTCCGQEIANRVSLDQLRAPETDEERDWADEERERWDGIYRDHTGAYADWDAMRDEAVANGLELP